MLPYTFSKILIKITSQIKSWLSVRAISPERHLFQDLLTKPLSFNVDVFFMLIKLPPWRSSLRWVWKERPSQLAKDA